jgi:hypothetical protein
MSLEDWFSVQKTEMYADESLLMSPVLVVLGARACFKSHSHSLMVAMVTVAL